MSSTKFVLESKGCAVVGFHGRSSSSVWALGAHFHPLPYGEKLEAQGGHEGVSWDDDGFDGIKNIYIGHNEMGITFVKFLYYKDNNAVVGDDHGSNILPEEWTRYDIVDGMESEVIRMLRFKTNMHTSQFFGLEITSNFTLEKECHKIVGFHGKANNMLTQIGVHVLPITE